MNTATLILKNVTRNRVRTVLTIAAVTLPMTLFVMTAALRAVFDGIAEKAAQGLRIGVHHKVSLINLMPSAGRRKIEALDPTGKYILSQPDPDNPGSTVRAVCSMRWFGGMVKDSQYRFPSLAGDADSLPLVYQNEVDLSPAERKAWMADKTAVIVGRATADAFGWKVGQEIELTGTVPPYLSLRFRIVKIADKAVNPAVVYFRLDYLRDSYEAAEKAGKGQTESGKVNIFWIKCADASKMEELMQIVDDSFANTPDETLSEDENAFFANFTKAGGDIPGKIQIIGWVVVLAIVMVVANTMSMTFRERTRELAAFRALGFPAGRIALMVLGESMLLAMLGGLAGVLPLTILSNYMAIKPIPGFPVAISVGTSTLVLAAVVTACVGLMAGIVPAVQAMRLKVVDALRNV